MFMLLHGVAEACRRLSAMAAMPVYARANFGSRFCGFLEGIEGLLKVAGELFVDAKRILMDGVERCGGKTSADLVELDRGRCRVAQTRAQRRGQPGKLAQGISCLLATVISALASTSPLTASRAVAEMSYLSPCRIDVARNDGIDATGLLPPAVPTARRDSRSDLGEFFGQHASIRAAVGVDKARALECHPEHRLQRVIQHRVAGMVREVANEHRNRCMVQSFRGLSTSEQVPGKSSRNHHNQELQRDREKRP